MESIEKCIVERTLHDRKTEIQLNERKLQIQECKVIVVKALDANMVVTESRIQNVSNSLGNECNIKENENNVFGNGNNKSENDREADGVDIRPIYDTDSLEQVHNDDYNVFAMEKEHLEQPESVNDTYLVKQGDSNTTHDSSNMSNDGGEADQDDAKEKERVLLASLIENMKREIDERKRMNKSLDASNKILDASNKLLRTKLERYNNVKYVKDVEYECAKAYGLLEDQ
ncbi:hypothetical protein Tco_1012310 [Tanacetum coccineum]